MIQDLVKFSDERVRSLRNWQTSDIALWLKTTGIVYEDCRNLASRFQEKKLRGADLETITQVDLIRVLRIVNTSVRRQLWESILRLRETINGLEAIRLEEQEAKRLITVNAISSDKKEGLKLRKGDLKLVRAVAQDHLKAMLSTETCSVCFEESSSVLILACGHSQCRTCLATFFRKAIKDRSLMPPKCCQIELDTQVVQDLLTEAEAKTFRQRYFELSAKNFAYCPDQKCSTFISLDPVINLDIGEVPCPKRGCKTILCVKCKGRWGDESHICIQLNADVAQDFKAKFKYQTCPDCKEMIELKMGCNHMICWRCKTHFCYVCGVKWEDANSKCCQCPLWIESNLYAEGKERVEAQRRLGLLRIGDEKAISPNASPTFPEVPNLLNEIEILNPNPETKNRKKSRPKYRSIQHAVEETVSRLRKHDHFACKHRWVRVDRGRLPCPHCDFYMWAYHMLCYRCKTRVCNTCARYRL